MTPPRDQLIQIRMSAEELKKLDTLARRFGQSRSAMLRHALLDFAEKQEPKKHQEK